MAGAGYKQFADGDVLTAAQVQTYLQDQAVMKFADSSARTTGLGTAVAEGMLSYLADTDAVEVYDGSAWVSVSPDPVGVLQVVVATDATNRSTSSQSLTSATISVTITPERTDSRILVFWTGTGDCGRGGTVDRVAFSVGINDGSGAVEGAEAQRFEAKQSSTSNPEVESGFTLLGRHTVSGAGALTFTGQFSAVYATSTVTLQNASTTGLMVAVEVA